MRDGFDVRKPTIGRIQGFAHNDLVTNNHRTVTALSAQSPDQRKRKTAQKDV
jgi:hypothetical protein